MAAQDWQRLYQRNYDMYQEKYYENLMLEEQKVDMQETYIFREQEYRRVIESLKATIDKVSQHPLAQTKQPTDD